MEKAKHKGEQELLLRRERLTMELEKLSRRMKEFEECSELDMMQQVSPDLAEKSAASVTEVCNLCGICQCVLKEVWLLFGQSY